MEVRLMIGRATNLVPTYVLVAQANYTGYFMLLGQYCCPLSRYSCIKKEQQI